MNEVSNIILAQLLLLGVIDYFQKCTIQNQKNSARETASTGTTSLQKGDPRPERVSNRHSKRDDGSIDRGARQPSAEDSWAAVSKVNNENIAEEEGPRTTEFFRVHTVVPNENLTIQQVI